MERRRFLQFSVLTAAAAASLTACTPPSQNSSGGAQNNSLVVYSNSLSDGRKEWLQSEAKAAGFLNRVVPPDALDAEVDGLVDALLSKSALTLAGTKRQVNAVTEGMVVTARSWNDADALVTAAHDPESRQAAMAYLDRVGRR